MKRERASALNRVKWFFYDLKVKIFGGGKSKPPRPHNKKAGQSVFLFFFMLLPILQFLIFYVGVNVNSLKLAFQKYDGTKYVFAGVENFGAVLKAIFTGRRTRPPAEKLGDTVCRRAFDRNAFAGYGGVRHIQRSAAVRIL